MSVVLLGMLLRSYQVWLLGMGIMCFKYCERTLKNGLRLQGKEDEGIHKREKNNVYPQETGRRGRRGHNRWSTT